MSTPEPRKSSPVSEASSRQTRREENDNDIKYLRESVTRISRESARRSNKLREDLSQRQDQMELGLRMEINNVSESLQLSVQSLAADISLMTKEFRNAMRISRDPKEKETPERSKKISPVASESFVEEYSSEEEILV